MTGSSPESQRPSPPRLDTGVPHSARVWNYLLGGKDNFAADREICDVRFFDGLTLVPPGVVTTSRWRPEIVDASTQLREVDAICGVGRKD